MTDYLIRDLPEGERPRERLLEHGGRSLSDSELLAVLLRTGRRGVSALQLALDLLRENGAEDVLVVVGGTIPTEDADELKKLGVADVFGPGARTSDIVEFLQSAVPA